LADDTMNDRLPPFQADAEARVARLFQAQREAFAAQRHPAAEHRRAGLRALKRLLHRYQDLLADAASRDFGFRSPTETKMLDVLSSTLDINHATSHLERWMRPSRRSTELLFATNSLRVVYQPKGVVGVIVPWNFPLYLALGPLAAAHRFYPVGLFYPPYGNIVQRLVLRLWLGKGDPTLAPRPAGAPHHA
jgi:coniferyl-aldehyde dehydrogenase